MDLLCGAIYLVCSIYDHTPFIQPILSARPTTNLLADRTPLSTDAWIRNCRRIGPLRGAAVVKRRVIINLCVDSDNGKAVVRCQRQRAIYTGYYSFGPCCTTCLQLGNRFSLALIPSALPREWVDYLRSQCDWGGCHVAGLKGSQEPAHLWLCASTPINPR